MRKFVLKCLVLALSLMIPFYTLTAQESGGVIDGILSNLSNIDDLYSSPASMEAINVDALPSSYDEAAAWVSARRDSRPNVGGLDFRTGYDRKFGSGSDDIYDDYYSYANRIYAMISWNILDCGFVGRDAFEKRVELQGQQYMMAEDNYNNIVAIRQASQLQSQLLDGYYNRVYQTKIELYNSLLAMQEELRSKGQSIDMDRVEIQMRIALNRGLIRATPIEVPGFMDIDRYLSMQFVIGESMVDSLLSINYILTEKELEARIVDSESDNINYWSQAELSPFVKAQHYTGQGFVNSNRTTANVGITATLPLFAGIKKKKSEVAARASLTRSSAQMLESSIRLDLEEEVRLLNKNYEELFVVIKLRDIALMKIEHAYRAYERKQLSIQDLAALYIPLLDLQIDLYDLITDREQLKSRLEIINNRN